MYSGYSREDSPPFQFQPAIVAAATYVVSLDNVDTTTQPAAAYAPMNQMDVQNNSGSDVKIQLGNRFYIVKGGMPIFSIEPGDVRAFWSFRITNLGVANINAGDLIVTIQRKGLNTDRAVQELARRLPR